MPPRTGIADTGLRAAKLATERRAVPNGVWGMALFLCAETMLFAGLIASYFYLDFRAPRWPPAGAPLPEVRGPAILTAVLVATTVPIVFASRRARAGSRDGTIAMLAIATLVQAGYVAYQLHALVGELHTTPPQSSAYASSLIALLALHHAHVLLGVLLNLGMIFWLFAKGLTGYRLTGVRAIALYWYVVNTIAVAVLLTTISPSL
ncbi:MAG TPA: cytochrome c oxidase subunit 3 [Solirubrobacteraceae bacterium]|nr:cytochrome c oxidase subunit 3 [Solirubrobacteraceae bacterium]